jgi:hypothetical protein
MLSASAVPLLMSIPVLALMGLAVRDFWRCRDCQDDDALMSASTLKVFWAYILP